MRLLIAFFALVLGTLPAAARQYVFEGSEISVITSRQTGADYLLYVSLPAGYESSGRSYPVVYLLDGDESFAIVRGVVRNLAMRDMLPPMILVGVAHPGAEASRDVALRQRTRDFTPVAAPEGDYGARFREVSGGAAKFRAFVASELTPFIELRYRAQPGDRTLVGHSYGGLFATYVLLTEPALFSRYVVISPSLWYAGRIAMTMEEHAAGSGVRPRARAFFAVGGLENQPGAKRPMIDDLEAFVGRLRSRNNPGLELSMRVFPGENHISVFPGAVTRGLLTVFAPGAP